MCQFPRHAYRDAIERGQKPSVFLRERLSSAAKVFFTIGLAYWGPALALGIVLFLRVNQLNTWSEGSCFVNAHGDIVCAGRNDTECTNRVLRTSFWQVSFCPLGGCPNGSIDIKISLNESTTENARSALSRHPVNSTAECYMNPSDSGQVVWKDSITGIFSWVIPVFIFFSMFTVLLIFPCFFMMFIAVKLQRFYRQHPDALNRNSERRIEPLSANLRRLPPSSGVEMNTLADKSVPDIYKLDLEASIDMNASKACNVCFAHRINCRLLPCKHKFTCMECGKYFVGKPCGLCRVDVVKVRKIVPRKRNLADQEGAKDTKQQDNVSSDGTSPTPRKKRQRKRSQIESPPHASADSSS